MALPRAFNAAHTSLPTHGYVHTSPVQNIRGIKKKKREREREEANDNSRQANKFVNAFGKPLEEQTNKRLNNQTEQYINRPKIAEGLRLDLRVLLRGSRGPSTVTLMALE